MKKSKIYIGIIIVCVVLVIGLCIFLIVNHDDEEITDAQKFKNEYEVYNDLVNENNGKLYLSVSIDEDNPVIYKTGKEILDVLEEETAIVYFGFPNCPWCRNIIKPLLNALEETNYDKLYYVDIWDIRDEYQYSGSIIPEQTKKGTDAYYEILDFLGDNLEEYYITEENIMYDTGVTRLYAPTVVTVKNGKVIGFHSGTLEEQDDPYVELDKDEQEKLKNIYIDMLEEINDTNDYCSDEGTC